MIQQKYLISICLPNYNNGIFIRESLISILEQSYSNTEIIIADNHSTDNSLEIIDKFRDRRISLLPDSGKTIPPESNFNRVINRSNGDFVSVYHSDDKYDRGIVEAELKFLLENPDCSAVFTLADRIDENGRQLGNVWVPLRFRFGGKFNHFEILSALLRYGYTPLMCPSVMLRRSALEFTELFKPELFGNASDTEMWLRLLMKNNIGIIGKRMLHYRVSRGQDSVKYNYLRTEEADFLKVAEHHINTGSFTQRELNYLNRLLSFRRKMDNIYRAASLVLKGAEVEAKLLLDSSISFPFILDSMLMARGMKKCFVGVMIYLFLIFKLNNLAKNTVRLMY